MASALDVFVGREREGADFGVMLRPDGEGRLVLVAGEAGVDESRVLLPCDDGGPAYQRVGFVAPQRCTLWTRPVR